MISRKWDFNTQGTKYKIERINIIRQNPRINSIAGDH